MDAAPANRSPAIRRALVAASFLAFAFLQLGPFVHGRPGAGGAWFLYGSDTVSHDAIAQIWSWNAALDGGVLPLWIPELKGGLPTLGSFWWAPFHPSLWLHAALPFPSAQRLQFAWALWWSMLGGYWLGRVLGRRPAEAWLLGIVWGLSGHLVTLVHAGHLQKVLALAWLAWGVGGVAKAAGDGAIAQRARGAAIGGLALGMMFLAGHPQIAYALVAVAAIRCAWPCGSPLRARIAALLAVLVLGGLVGAAQLLPGMEMSRWSNRADGVSYEEAVETSHPPGELLEFVLPRHRGDTSAVGLGVYHGSFGDERIVSDYAGAFAALLALLGVAALLRTRGLRAEALFWSFLFLLFVLVGAGGYTPFYGMLHNHLPGFDSFRSPATFFAPALLALAVLASAGAAHLRGLASESLACGSRTPWVAGLVIASTLCMAAALLLPGGSGTEPPEILAASIRRSLRVVQIALLGAALCIALAKRWRHAGAALVLFAGLWTAGDLAHANRSFLVAVDWDSYSAFLDPDALDLAIAGEPAPVRVHEIGREMSLRPILNGRDSMLGYHPISFQAFEDHLVANGLGTPEWRSHWGIGLVWSPEAPDPLPDGWQVVAAPRTRPGGVLLRDESMPRPVRAADGASVSYEWIERSPNRLRLRVDPAGPVIIAENAAPGWIVGDANGRSRIAEPAIERRAEPSPGGEVLWSYEPFSFRAGVFLTALGLMAFALLFAGSVRRTRLEGMAE